ncbi:MAG: 6-phosphogluconolactonase [Rhizobacter sp.]|nr:6-phosphogluconolactonase [Rhizobacter sp.]
MASLRTAVFVSSADSGELRVFHLDQTTGGLTEVQCLPLGGQVMPLAISPDRRFLYAARRTEPMQVLSFAIDAATGFLTALGASALPHSMANIATDRSGRFLFSASYGGDLIAVSPIGADGVAGEAQQVLPTPPKAHAVHASPSNRWVFAASLGGGVVMQFAFDASTGQLSPNDPAELHPHDGASPRHFVFSNDSRFVYLLGELDAQIDVLAFDESTGSLRTLQTVSSLLPGYKADQPWAADLHLTPDGRFLYASERRTNSLACFCVDPTTGLLTLLRHTDTETQPRGFHITRDGSFLIAAGQTSHHLEVYAIDADSGVLSPQSRHEAGLGPNWVETITLVG